MRLSEDVLKNKTSRRYYSCPRSWHSLQGGAARNLPLTGHTIMLLTPKDGGRHMKSLLQEVLKLYMEELPTMNYAANTGKRSKFLERCLISGKYNTLILSPNSSNGLTQVIAAITFQIVPADTQFAEIPLTAVASAYQNKGIGCMMYEELKERLKGVGILTIFCWADKESEQFWLKQGFISVGEVDGKGKARKLPVIEESAHDKQSMKEFFSSCMEKTTDNKCQSDEIFFSPKQSGKRITWEASVSALNSKRVKGSHVLNHGVCPMKNCDSLQIEGNDACFAKGPNQESVDQINCPRIMFMDIIDDDKRSRLTKIVEELGGSVARTATSSTHLITGKARRTLNFCLSLCSGVWIVSPSWLKSSFRVGKFLDESQHILEDEEYRMKYNCKLKDAVTRARTSPRSLLRGYQVCLSKHVQPSINDLSSIILTAGGRVIRGLKCMTEPSRTIFLAGEEDVEEALLAAKMGIRTFGIDWLINCVMRQHLDLEADRFAESL
ncbi:hypothetical protein HPP92_002859 [Vanilla planifolia]|uniref:BRCT domain-containing protein n=1 Tax=Vanilla planifolia TaxID=51239 RepID=A0A835SFE3_VANPL|nr:hypothetical protein HPP92_002859 [Vanilla planifolia]